MCGIFCCVVHRPKEKLKQETTDYADCSDNNQRRGPDDLSPNYLNTNINDRWSAEFRGWVLWTQGTSMTSQPYQESSGNILLWNGDIFAGPLAQTLMSDTKRLYSSLEETEDVVQILGLIEGPFSFIYYKKSSQMLYFGRDFIGRHSLLMKIIPEKQSLIISSVASKNLDNYIEVPSVGVFMMDLKDNKFNLTIFPWQGTTDAIDRLKERLGVDIDVRNFIFPTEMNKITAEPLMEDIPFLNSISSTENVENMMQHLLDDPDISKCVNEILERLKESVRLRVEKKPDYCRDCIKLKLRGKITNCRHPKIGLLFSGGLDSTILAAIAHEFIPENESIDLINIAFEKAKRDRENTRINENNEKDETTQGYREINFEVPDRKTGRQAWKELESIFPSRQWNFLESNVTQVELDKCRSERICHIIYPLQTILDESLGCALWFAARGSGTLANTKEPYESPCRILLLGMGADELFGGYSRHRTTLRRRGWVGLAEELDTELTRIAERNLGRDDRVVSDHGRQSRLPYLDDDFVRYVRSLKPWERCCLTEKMPPGLGDKLLLRLCALRLGLKQTSTFPKRAFQFGSRIAKSHENASDISKWLL